MRIISKGLAAFACGALLAVMAPPVHAQSPAPREATLRLLNRDIVTLRASLAGATPELRAERAQQRIFELPTASRDKALQALPFQAAGAKGVEIMVGEHSLFTLVDADIDPEARQRDLDALARQTVANLEAARQAWHEIRDPGLFWAGVLRALLVCAAVALLVWLVSRAARRSTIVLERRRRVIAAGHRRVVAREWTLRATTRSVRLVKWLLYAALAYAAVHLVLGAFVLSQPLAERLGGWTLSRALWLLDGITAAVPSLISLLIIVAATRLVTDLMNYGFDAVQGGRLRVAGLHTETIGATRRIATLFVWALGAAIAYPYLPGASSQAFKGISVIVGLMVTLGSTGIVAQAMSGLVVIYARALRHGDHVVVGEVEGVVTEISAMATKLVNLRNEEITIPNSVLVGSAIRNFSKLASTQGTLLSTIVTLGYDVPWRRAHQLLEDAARATPGLRSDPPARVYQHALASFYVEYELQVSTDTPMDRVALLSALRANILDAAERAGIQLLSPDFLANIDAGRLPAARA